MQFRHIMENLKSDYEITIVSDINTDKITDIQLLDAKASSFENGILYIGDVSSLNPDIFLPEQLISITPITKQSLPIGNFAIIRPEDLSSVFNYVHRLFYESLQLSNDFSQLIAMSIRGDSGQTIVNAAAQKLKNPVIVIDTGFKVLLYSDNFEITDRLWTENIARGYCTYEFITAVNEIMANTVSPINSISYILNCPASPHSKLCSKIFWNNSLIGYTIMLEEKTPLNLMQSEMLPNISYVMSDILSKSPDFSGIHGSLKSILLYHLLEDKQFENIYIRMKASKIEPPKNMCCLVAACSTLSDEKQWERFALEQLSLAFPQAYITPYKGYLVVLVALSNTLDLKEKGKKKLNELLPKVSKNLYISQNFTNIFSCRNYFEQCLFLHNLSLKLDMVDTILSYDAFAFYDLLAHYPNQTDLSVFVNPALKILKQYDEKNSTFLYETLRKYIECQYNATQTAAALFIHRNSLSYRMEKIEELTRISLNDSNQLFHITSSFYIENYLS